jgi:aspartyl protease family protein
MAASPLVHSKTILIAGVWLAVAAALFYFINLQVNPNTAGQLVASSAEVSLKRDLAGHYRAEAYINGIKIPAMVDTGATDVAISQSLADKLGLHSIHGVRTSTANGETVSYMTRLASVQLGGIVAHDVSASITPRLGDEILLGMSFLNRMDVRLYQGTMTIRQISD